ncbi:MAG: hypothetical protein NC311_20150 [Muribaculaceae bacterium]|nr:hypothetical protein [Muribaculaceae bacterium]
MGDFRAGAGTGTIRFPEKMFPLQGFKGIHDEPHVRILYFDQKEKWAIAAYEIVMLPDGLVEECRECIAGILGLEKENVWLHMTHAVTTPHEPESFGMERSASEASRKTALFEQALIEATQDAARQAAASVRAAMLGVGSGASYINCCRDVQSEIGWWTGVNPEGFSVRDMTVLKVTDREQRPIALLISYDVKPCAVDNSQMKENERLVSSDVPGRACVLLEEKYGVPVLFCMAASGDQIPRKTALYDVIENGQVRTVDLGVEAGFAIVEELGGEMARDAMAIAEGIKIMTQPSEICLRTGSFRHGTKRRMELRPRMTAVYEADGETELTVSTVQIGAIAFVGCRPEVNCITDRQLRDRSPKEHTLIVSLLNGGMKYMPDRQSYDRVTNEAQSSLLMPGAAEKFVDMAAGLLSGADEDGSL